MNVPIETAFVLGAGLGTRLRSLTAHRPKPLLPICQKPLVTFAFDHLIRNGAKKIIINTHHCRESYPATFPDSRYRGVPLHFEHEPTLLETGGGIKNIEPLVRNHTFIVYNGDILTDLPLDRAVREHFERRNEVTLVLRSFGGPLHISLDEQSGRVIDIAGRLRGEEKTQKYLFACIYIVSPSFLFRIPSRTKISVIPIFLNMIQKGHALGGVVIDEGQWWDLGTRENYLDVHRFFSQPDFPFKVERGVTAGTWPQWIHPSARIAQSARISGATVIGAGANVGERAQLTDCVLWEEAHVAPDSVLKSCIVTAGQVASGSHANFDF